MSPSWGLWQIGDSLQPRSGGYRDVVERHIYNHRSVEFQRLRYDRRQLHRIFYPDTHSTERFGEIYEIWIVQVGLIGSRRNVRSNRGRRCHRSRF